MGLLLNRAKANTATAGTGAVTPGSAVVPYQTWALAGATAKYLYSYLIEEGNDWEVGVGYYDGTTITRPGPGVDAQFASSTGALLNLAGAATIACVANKSDHLHGGLFMPPNAADFTLFSGDATAATLTNDSDAGLLVSTGTAAGTTVIRGGYKVLPAVGTDFSVTAKINLVSTPNANQGGGIILYEHNATLANAKAHGVMVFHAAGNHQIRRQTLGGTYNSDQKFEPGVGTFETWVRIARVGTTITVSRSATGKSFKTLQSFAQNVYMTTAPDRIGPGVWLGHGTDIPVLSVPYWHQDF